MTLAVTWTAGARRRRHLHRGSDKLPRKKPDLSPLTPAEFLALRQEHRRWGLTFFARSDLWGKRLRASGIRLQAIYADPALQGTLDLECEAASFYWMSCQQTAQPYPTEVPVLWVRTAGFPFALRALCATRLARSGHEQAGEAGYIQDHELTAAFSLRRMLAYVDEPTHTAAVSAAAALWEDAPVWKRVLLAVIFPGEVAMGEAAAEQVLAEPVDCARMVLASGASLAQCQAIIRRTSGYQVEPYLFDLIERFGVEVWPVVEGLYRQARAWMYSDRLSGALLMFSGPEVTALMLERLEGWSKTPRHELKALKSAGEAVAAWMVDREPGDHPRAAALLASME